MKKNVVINILASMAVLSIAMVVGGVILEDLVILGAAFVTLLGCLFGCHHLESDGESSQP